MPSHRCRGQVYWMDAYRRRGAIWVHDGNMKRPHAELTGGNHSSGYFNSDRVMEDALLLDAAAHDLVTMLRNAGLDLQDVDRVIGPVMGAVTLAHDLCRRVAVRFNRLCLCGYAEKRGEGSTRIMTLDRIIMSPGEQVLLTEDVVSRGRSARLTAEALTRKGVKTLPFLPVLVNRSGRKSLGGRLVVSLISHPMPTWTAAECPLCERGSVALRPKEGNNWALLNSTY